MKRDRVEYSKTIQTGTPLNPSWEKAFIGATLDENEDPKESLEILKREVEMFHEMSNGGPYPVYPIKESTVDWPVGKTYVTGGQVPVIQLENERLAIQIDNCKSLEELKELKEGLPRDLMSAYMNKLRELTNIKTS